MTHALTADRGLCDLDTASVADNTLITYLLILTAMALPVLGWSKNAFAEKTVLLRLEGTIVDGLRLFDFTVGPLADTVRRCKSDLDRVKCHRLVFFLLVIKFSHVCLPYSDRLRVNPERVPEGPLRKSFIRVFIRHRRGMRHHRQSLHQVRHTDRNRASHHPYRPHRRQVLPWSRQSAEM